jgi:hypothetical protein
MANDIDKDNGEIIIYQSEDGKIRYILNAYKEKEIEEAKTMRKIGISDFSTKPTNYYNPK